MRRKLKYCSLPWLSISSAKIAGCVFYWEWKLSVGVRNSGDKTNPFSQGGGRNFYGFSTNPAAFPPQAFLVQRPGGTKAVVGSSFFLSFLSFPPFFFLFSYSICHDFRPTFFLFSFFLSRRFCAVFPYAAGMRHDSPRIGGL